MIEDEQSKDRILSFARAVSILPETHFVGIKGIDFRKESLVHCGGKAEACYNPVTKKIIIPSDNEGTAVHEIVHHWNLYVLKHDGEAYGGRNPSSIFYRISWVKNPFWELRRSVFDEEDFAYWYGKKSRFEDMATSAESYVYGTWGFTRPNVRQQMKLGNFEPAAKYLFNKYVRSFEPKDGLCFEYNLSPDDPPLTFAEVKGALASWLSAHPGSVARSTVKAIDQIESVYLAERDEFQLGSGQNK